MVRIEELFTEEEIKAREDRRNTQRKADEGNMAFAQLCGRLLRISEEMFLTPFYDFLFGKSVIGRNYAVTDEGIMHGASYYTVRMERYNLFSSIQANPVFLYGFKYSEGSIFMKVHDPSKNILRVSKPNRLNDALKLAKAYEEAGFGEFTVKKQYEE